MTGEIQKWADVAMFKADEIDADQGPQVTLLSCNPDPLGTIAAAALMYEGKSVQSLADITDEQRRYYLEQTAKTALAAPLEFVNFHFIISGVTRGFTHQMVRQRTATYTQESTRFAVKEDVPVGRPPSLEGTLPWKEWVAQCAKELFPGGWSGDYSEGTGMINDYANTRASQAQLWRREWDDCVGDIDAAYNGLVSAGMPAEDARGLLPTNLLTRINYNSSLRGLLEHSGVRLCTQAQFEWRQVWTGIKAAIVEYGKRQYQEDPRFDNVSSAWQFEELAKVFKPICYQRGSCQFNADVDRACSIKKRVEQFASLGIPSVRWNEDYVRWPKDAPIFDSSVNPEVVISPINESEWMLDPSAARVSQ